MMRISVKNLLVLAAILAPAIAVAGCSSGWIPAGEANTYTVQSASSTSAKPINGLVQSSDGGAVTIDVKWLAGEEDALVFQVSMDTHSADLDGYDLGKLAILRDDTGQQYQPVSWDSGPGGHHRSGSLSFAILPSLDQGQLEFFDIVIRDVSGIAERVLRWQLR